jgi:hypothetical protein
MKIVIQVGIIVLCFMGHLLAWPPNRIWGRVEYQYQNRDIFSVEQTVGGGADREQSHQLMIYGNMDLTAGSWLNIHPRLYCLYRDDRYRFTVLETYWDHKFKDQFLMRVGRQRVAWGSGYAWNPTDMLEPAKNPYNPQEEREGLTAIKSEFLTGNCSLTLLTIYNDIYRRIELAVKSGLLINSHEFSFSVHQVPRCTPSVGFDYCGFISGIEFHSELALFNSQTLTYWPVSPGSVNKNLYVVKSLIGTMYTWKPNGMLVLEYYHNRNRDLYAKYLPDQSIFQNPFIMELWQDILFLMAMKRELLGLIDIQVMIFSHLNSSCFIIAPKIIVTPLQELSVEIVYHGLSRFNGRQSVISGWNSEMIQIKTSVYF